MNDRYIRHRALSGFGDEAQQKLEAASVLVVGAGGLGVPVLQYLNAMGVGRIGIVDADTVSVTNLHRQPLYTEADIGKEKSVVAANFLKQQNSTNLKEVYPQYLNPENALDLIASYDVIVDASDNFATRYLVNDACVILGKPFVYGGLFGFEGQVSVFNYQDGPTYRCLYPEMTDGVVADCNTHGVLGVVPGIIGNLQALEAVKVITGIGGVLSGTLLLMDTLSMQVFKMRIRPKEENKTIDGLSARYEVPGCRPRQTISPEMLADNPEDYFLLDVRSKAEFTAWHIEGSVNIPLEELEGRLDEVAGTKPVCLICKRAVRTQSAGIMLEDHPTEVYELEGGLDNYHRKVAVGRTGIK